MVGKTPKIRRSKRILATFHRLTPKQHKVKEIDNQSFDDEEVDRISISSDETITEANVHEHCSDQSNSNSSRIESDFLRIPSSNILEISIDEEEEIASIETTTTESNTSEEEISSWPSSEQLEQQHHDRIDFLGIPPSYQYSDEEIEEEEVSDLEDEEEECGEEDDDEEQESESRPTSENDTVRQTSGHSFRKQTKPKNRKDQEIEDQTTTKLLIPRLPFQRYVQYKQNTGIKHVNSIYNVGCAKGESLADIAILI